VATAENVYVDPSALLCLYIHQEGSREMAKWRHRATGAISVTHHGRAELVNSVGLALFQERLEPEDAFNSWQNIENDFHGGELVQPDILWRAALNRAAELSRSHTPKLGTRSLDVLHVSCALELGRRYFLSFDDRQKALAEAVGLKLVAV
jgi:hypothetical protein